MQQPCPRCGHVSEQLAGRPVRFCRQCGAPLVAESSVTEAETRNYGQLDTNEQFGHRPYTPRWSAPAQEPPPETTHFYQAPPMQPAYTQPPAPKKSRAGLWLLIAFLSLLLVGGTMAGIAALVLKPTRPEMAGPSDRPGGLRGHPPAPKEPPPPPEPGIETSGSEELPESLRKYFYPGAEVITSVEAMGQEVVELKTEDGMDKVGEFYRKLLGPPNIVNRGKRDAHYMWQVKGSPGTMINVQTGDEPEETKISLIRSGFIPELK